MNNELISTKFDGIFASFELSGSDEILLKIKDDFNSKIVFNNGIHNESH
jgi:hypothetical protein